MQKNSQKWKRRGERRKQEWVMIDVGQQGESHYQPGTYPMTNRPPKSWIQREKKGTNNKIGERGRIGRYRESTSGGSRGGNFDLRLISCVLISSGWWYSSSCVVTLQLTDASLYLHLITTTFISLFSLSYLLKIPFCTATIQLLCSDSVVF